MKREIKFRAWYDTGKTWIYLTIGQTMTSVAEAIYSRLCLDGATWYQFTGLTDKNGVEIYEGDIDSDHRVFTFNTSMGGWYLVRDGEGVQWHSTCLTHGGTRLPHEIIGNIHENKELI